MPNPTLSEAGVMSAFAQACVEIYRDWQLETPAVRRSKIQQAVRDAARSAALPDFGFYFKTMAPTRGGEFNQQAWRLDINSHKSDVHGLTRADFVSFCSVLYHESRHGEQWYRCAQGVLAGDLTNPWLDGVNVAPEHVRSTMYLPLQVVEHAESRGKINWNKYKGELPVAGWFDSIWGVNRAHRGNVLTHLQTMYAEYRALPEEVDAWATQFDLEALINPLLLAVAQHQVEASEPVKDLRAQHTQAITGPTGLAAQLQSAKLKHVTKPEASSKVKAVTSSHQAAIAQSSTVSTSAPIDGTGAQSRVRELVAAQNGLLKQLGKVH